VCGRDPASATPPSAIAPPASGDRKPAVRVVLDALAEVAQELPAAA
jgi:hypothetical protein